MTSDNKSHAVMRQLMALGGLSVEELKDKWRDLYGAESPELKHSFLVKRLAYRIQELYYGGLEAEVKARLESLAVPEGKRKQPASTTPGTRLTRIYKGEKHEVIIAAKRYDYNGQNYRSLTAIALAITGTHCNGKAFFGIGTKQ